MTFEDYLRDLFSESTVIERMSFHTKNTKVLSAHGIDIENDISTTSSAFFALKILEQVFATNTKKKQRIQTFKLFYNFKTGRWLDYWKPAGKRTPKSRRVPKNKKTQNIQEIIPPRLGFDMDRHLIFYDSNINPQTDRVPELTSFLHEEYEYVIGNSFKMFSDRLGEEIHLGMIPVLLSDETPVEFYPIDNQTRAKMIMGLKASTNGNYSEQDVLDVLNEEHIDRVMGRYIAEKTTLRVTQEGERIKGPYIIIYYKNIPYGTEEEYFATLSMVLAHEYLHHLHHMQVGDKEFSKKGEKDKRVKESLADFFGVWFLLDMDRPHNPYLSAKMTIARECYDSWLTNISFNWPYSYALYLHGYNYYTKQSNYPKSVISKFIEVFRQLSFKTAYRILII